MTVMRVMKTTGPREQMNGGLGTLGPTPGAGKNRVESMLIFAIAPANPSTKERPHLFAWMLETDPVAISWLLSTPPLRDRPKA